LKQSQVAYVAGPAAFLGFKVIGAGHRAHPHNEAVNLLQAAIDNQSRATRRIEARMFGDSAACSDGTSAGSCRSNRERVRGRGQAGCG
jgi:hypothetical protein